MGRRGEVGAHGLTVVYIGNGRAGQGRAGQNRAVNSALLSESRCRMQSICVSLGPRSAW